MKFTFFKANTLKYAKHSYHFKLLSYRSETQVVFVSATMRATLREKYSALQSGLSSKTNLLEVLPVNLPNANWQYEYERN